MLRVLPVVLLVALSVVYRLPPLLNAPDVNSDVAVVGLQAMHILDGHWSWFLPGSGYQTSVDSLVAAGFFHFLGITPLVLMVSAFSAYVVLTLLVYFTLRHHLKRWTAFVATLPLVFTPPAVHTYALHPPRQAALTLVFFSIWLLHGASRSAHANFRYALGSGVAFLAYFADPYALVFLPAVMLFAALATRDGAPDGKVGLARVQACGAGVVLGAIPVTLLRLSRHATPGQTTLRFDLIRHNARLLKSPCLPWALSYRAYWEPDGTHYVPWHAGAFSIVQDLGAALLVLGFLSGFVAFFLTRRVPWRLRRLGLAGALVLPLTIGGFLTSVMVMDLFSMRYLSAIVLAAPFALAPLAYLVERRVMALLLAPYLISAALCGWLGYVPYVHGWRVIDIGAGEDWAKLQTELKVQGVHEATADYWSSYRLTFLSKEHFIVVPLHASEDRYAPYRSEFKKAKRYAYIFDPRRSLEDFTKTAARLPGKRQIELTAGRLRAVVYQR
jgi:hypothetical protein